MEGYMTVIEAADKWGLSARRVQTLISQNRVIGAEKIGGKMWVIPVDAEKPKDDRVKSGKYVGDWAKYRKHK